MFLLLLILQLSAVIYVTQLIIIEQRGKATLVSAKAFSEEICCRLLLFQNYL